VLLPFWVRRTGKWRSAAAALCGAVWLPSFSVAVLTGGELIPALYYLVFAAALAAVTLGYQVGVAIAVVNAVVLAAIYALHLSGAEFPVRVDTSVALHSAMRGAFIFNFALAGLVAAYELLRNAAMRESQKNERRYRALADYGPDLIAELDSRGRIVHSSAGGSALSTALVGRSALDAVHRDDQPALWEALDRLETQQSVRTGPLRWLKSKTEAIWFEASLTRFKAENEWHMLVVARDVSDRIALEAQLRQSQKMQAVGQLASGLAHDFNNLLMVISGYAELEALRSQHDANSLSALGEIQGAAEQGAALTRRLVALSRPSSIDRRTLDLGAVVRENERMLRVLLGESVSLLLELAPGELRVSADAGEIEQILVNLVANARDALPQGGTVRVATLAREEHVSIVVHDNGPGMEASLRERIFEPFFTTKASGHGTGLGLYVVYSIVSSLGGEIQVQSEIGRGTRFTINLPVAAAAGGAEAAIRRISRRNGGSERILLVEDRPELRAMLREALESVGYQVIAAADGMEALALEVSARIDLVVTDVVMPRMGGIALVAELRVKHPELRALFLSGHPQQPGDPARIAAGDRLLRKPFLLRELRSVVREVLDAG
jgi:PAS domain S-box-containing protein